MVLVSFLNFRKERRSKTTGAGRGLMLPKGTHVRPTQTRPNPIDRSKSTRPPAMMDDTTLAVIMAYLEAKSDYAYKSAPRAPSIPSAPPTSSGLTPVAGRCSLAATAEEDQALVLVGQTVALWHECGKRSILVRLPRSTCRTWTCGRPRRFTKTSTLLAVRTRLRGDKSCLGMPEI